MKNLIEKERSIPVSDSCDVFVAGGGIAGVAAALAAARQGKKVILTEKEFLLGGLGTLGLIAIYLPLCDGMGRQVSFGIAEELLKLSVCHGPVRGDIHSWAVWPKPWFENGTDEEKRAIRYSVQYNPWIFAMEMEQLLKKNGVKILYGTLCCKTELSDGKITHMIVENISGRSAIEVKSVVDATGDAVICQLAGEETALFTEKNVLACWYYYHSNGNLELKQYGARDYLNNMEEGNPEKPLTSDRYCGVDAEENSEMVIRSREKLLEDVLRARRETDPHLELASVSAIPQVRMTRRLNGATLLHATEDHQFRADSIGCIGSWRKRGPAYEIPLSSLYGNKVRNLITAGRCISSDDEMWNITRVIPVCAVTGEGAGIAAALSDDFSTLDLAILQKALEDKGVMLHL